MSDSLGRRSVSGRARHLLAIGAAALAALVFVEPLTAVVAEAVDPSLATVTGSVFKDRDGDGEQESGEPGIAGVTVTDGVTRVRTDDTGSYTLALDVSRRLTDIVYITKPAGYDVPTDEWKTPLFYRALGQVGEGATSQVDFGLVPDPEGNSGHFTFANIADSHVNKDLATQIEQINSSATDLAFLQISGDLTDNATDAEFQRHRAATARSALPVWPAVGNHEYRPGATYADRIDNYRRYLGPEWYSFDHGDRHFVVLDNIGAAPYEEQRAWITKDLEEHAAGKRVVILMHQPMNVPFGSPSTYDSYAEVFEGYDTELVLVGHEHANQADESWIKGARHVQTNSSSYTIDHSPRGFRFVRMWGDGSDNPFRMYGVDQALTITSPEPSGTVSGPALDEIVVSAYRTSDEIRSVRYRLDNRTWHKMTKSGDWTWHAALPGRAPAPGEHTLEVSAVGGDAVWSATSTFTVTGRAAAVVEPGADWAQYHGDAAHSGVAADEVKPDLELAWINRGTGAILTGSPAIVDGVAYVGSRDENGAVDSGIRAIDLRTGDTLWRTRTAASVHGSPAVADGLVFVPTIDGTLYALDRATGQERWRRAPEPAGEGIRQRAYSYYSPAVADGTVFWPYQTRYGKASRGLLAALDTQTGAARWESPMSGSTMSDGTPAVVDGKVYVGNQTADRVLAYDAATGAQLWQSQAMLGGWQDAAPSVAEGRVFLGSNNRVVAKNALTGVDLWSHRSPDASYIPGNATPSTPAIVEDVMYMGFPDGRVTALNVLTGTVVWTQRLPGKPYLGGVLSAPAVSGDTLYIGSNNGRFYALDRSTGGEQWSYDIGSWVASAPAVSGDTVVVGAWDGNVYAFTEKE